MFIREDTANTIEAKLAKALEGKRWIGELQITRDDFSILANVTHAQGKPEYVAKRMFVASMVFSARYAEFADEESINFWTRYLKDVWQIEYDQTFASTCRKYFREARAYLQEGYGMEFPVRPQTLLDVVSGVYLHAILPSYLLDDFAEFFLKVMPDLPAWQIAIDQSVEEIAQHWQTSLPPLYLRRRLLNFVTQTETNPTAARLAQTLATAALWYSEGQDAALINDALAPIEQSIWSQLLPKLRSEAGKAQRRARTPGLRIRWAWLYEENDILELHVKNMPLKGETSPDRLIWLPANAAKSVKVGEIAPEYGTAFCEVNAWQTEAGYHIDSATLIDIDQAGVVTAVNQQDRALSMPLPTGSLPKEDVVFFRIQSDDRLSVLTEQSALTDGLYAVSSKSSIVLAEAQEKIPLKPTRQLMVPRILRALGHDHAAVYDIKLPILVGEQRVEKRRTREAPTLTGARPLAGLIPSAMPVFEQGDIWVFFTLPFGVQIEKLSLRLTINNDAPKVISMADLRTQGAADPQEQRWRVRLNGLLPASCLFQVEVFSGLTCLNNELLIAALLPPEVTIQQPNSDTYHTIEQPPTIIVKGVSREQVELASDAVIETQADGVAIRWRDPRQDTALRLQLDGVSIPLTFGTRWSYAWAEPLSGSLLWEEALPDAILHVRGAPRAQFSITVADREPRPYELNARGIFDTKLSGDALIDILRTYQGERVPVYLQFGTNDKPIHLFTLIRPSFADFERKPELVKQAVRAFRDKMRASRRQGTIHGDSLLSLVPTTYVDTISESDLPSPLTHLRQITNRPYSEFEGTVFPKRNYQLNVSDTVSYPLTANDKGWSFSLPRWIAGNQEMIEVHITQEGNAVYARQKSLRQCRRCGGFYWQDDTTSKIKHGHGKFGIDGADLESEPISGSLTWLAPTTVTLQQHTPRFSRFIDEGAEHTFRLDQTRKRAREVLPASDPLSLGFYRHATARWVLRTDFDENLKQLRGSKDFVARITENFLSSDRRVLVIAGKWIAEQRVDRKIDENSWLMLDIAVMTLAVIARAYAHELDVNAILNNKAEEDQFMSLLKDAHAHCPELLIWAFCWTEVFFTHWRHSDR